MATAARQSVLPRQISDTEKIIGFSPEQLKAPFFLRCAALCIDYIVLLSFPIGWLIVSSFFRENATNVSIGGTVWFLGFMLFLINFLMLPLFRGQTIGKMLAGVTIVNIDGSDLKLAGIIRRNVFGYLITVLTLGIGFLISAVNLSGRSLHDFIAGTVVVRGRKIRV